MTIKEKKKINIAQLIAPILSSRDTIDVLENKIEKTQADSLSLNFVDTKFISRSVAHALLVMKEKLRDKKEIDFVNTNKDITKMLRIVAANRAVAKRKKPEFKPDKVNIKQLFKSSAM